MNPSFLRKYDERLQRLDTILKGHEERIGLCAQAGLDLADALTELVERLDAVEKLVEPKPVDFAKPKRGKA
jgi:hypothetical protein